MWLVNYLINEIWFHVACTNYKTLIKKHYFNLFKNIYNCRMKKNINRQSNSEVMIKSMPVIALRFLRPIVASLPLFFHGLFKDLVRPANYYL